MASVWRPCVSVIYAKLDMYVKCKPQASEILNTISRISPE